MAGDGPQRRVRAEPGRRPRRGTRVPPVPVRSGQPAAPRGRRPVRRRQVPVGCRVDAALDRVGLLVAARKRYRAYSLGMRQRLAIASALLVPRDLLVLDEPTNGLDPQGTREVRHLVSELAADGTTVLVSSHLLSEVEQMCDHVGVMYAGRLVAQQPLADLHAGTATTVRVLTTAGAGDETLTTLARSRSHRRSAPLRRRRPRHRDRGPGRRRAGPGGARAGRGGVPVLGFEVASRRAWRTCSSRSPGRGSRSVAESEVLAAGADTSAPSAPARWAADPLPGLRARADLPSSAQPGRSGRAGRRTDHPGRGREDRRRRRGRPGLHRRHPGQRLVRRLRRAHPGAAAVPAAGGGHHRR